jgi:hypothetical protein
MHRPTRRSTLIHALGLFAMLAISPIVAAGSEVSQSIHHCIAATASPVIDAAEPRRLAPSCIVSSGSTGMQDHAITRVAVFASPADIQPATDSEASAVPSVIREPLREGGHALLGRLANAAVEWLSGATVVATPALIEVEVLRALLAVRLDLWLDGASMRQRSAVDKLIRARTAALLPTVLGDQVGGLAAALITPSRSQDVTVRVYRIDVPSDRPVADNGSCARRA